jgi:short-subunit dehydrogenase
MLNITMKTALISGASDGIGKCIAIKLSKQSINLILFGRDESKLQEVRTTCEVNGVKVETYAFDLLDNQKRHDVIEGIIAEQQIDILINNAGIWHKVGDITSLSEEKIQEVINVNLTSHILLTRQLLNHMRNRDGTAIVNIVSRSGLVAQAGQSAYTASKYGLKGFTDVLREDTKTDPIRVAGVYQSGTNTGLFAKAGDNMSTENFTNPDDLADVVVFMLTRPEKIWLNEVHITY